MAVPVLRPLTIGEVLDVAFGLYRSLFFPLVIVAVTCRAVPLMLDIYMQQNGTIFSHWKLALVGLLVSVILNALAVAATTIVVAGAYLGQQARADAALRRAAHLIGKVALVSFLTTLAVAMGMVLLVVPGLILLSGLALSTVVLVLEPSRGAISAMDRSWALTSGFRWKVLISTLTAALLLVVPTMIVGIVSGVGAFSRGSTPAAQLVPSILISVLSVFTYPFLYVVITVLYYDLRVRKEGFDLELLATATLTA